MLQDFTTLSTFFFSLSRPLFGLIIHVYYGAVKKRPAQENIQCCEPKSRKRAGIRE